MNFEVLSSVGWFSFALHVTCFACSLFSSRVLFLLLLSHRLKHGCQPRVDSTHESLSRLSDMIVTLHLVYLQHHLGKKC